MVVRYRSVTLQILEKPELYPEEMAVSLWDEFDVIVLPSSIIRTLRLIKWSKKIADISCTKQQMGSFLAIDLVFRLLEIR